MSLDPSILAALDTIYAAAADQKLWPEVVQNVLDLTDSQAASFCVLNASDSPTLPIFHYLNVEKRSVDMDRFLKEYLEEGMAAQDPTIQHIVANPRQHLVRDSALITEPEKDRSFYYSWHKGFSDTRHRAAGMAAPAPGVQSGITVHRTHQRGDYEDRYIERFEFLLPHIERAVRIGFQIGTLGAIHRASIELLDRNPRAIVLLGKSGRVVFANRAAQAFAAAGDGIVLSPDGLALQHPRENGKLQQLIKAALKISAATPDRFGMMRALRPSGKKPFGILVSPLSPRTDVMTSVMPSVCVIIADPECQTTSSRMMVRKLFGLTPAESRLALKLAQGDTLNRAAAELGIAYSTARTQLAVIFRKTGTSRQGELIKLLVADVPSLHM